MPTTNPPLLTAKLRSAISILCGERLADCPDIAAITALQKRRLTPSQIFKSVGMLGYRYDPRSGTWFIRGRHTIFVKRIISVIQKTQDEIGESDD